MNELTSRDFTDGGRSVCSVCVLVRGGQKSEPNDPDAMALATVDANGLPNVRMVLLKDGGPSGFVFYTIRRAPRARSFMPICRRRRSLHWKSLRRQVRLRGPVSFVDDADADAYFASRPLQSQDRRLGKPAIAAARKPVRARVCRGQICREIWLRRSSAAAALARLQDFAALSRILVGRHLPSARPYRFPAANVAGAPGARSAFTHEPGRFFAAPSRTAAARSAREYPESSLSWRQPRRLSGRARSSRPTRQAAFCGRFFAARRPRRGGRDLGGRGLAGIAEEVRSMRGSSRSINSWNLIDRDGAGKIRHHYVIASFAGEWIAGEAKPGPEASETVWAEPSRLAALDCTPKIAAVVEARANCSLPCAGEGRRHRESRPMKRSLVIRWRQKSSADALLALLLWRGLRLDRRFRQMPNSTSSWPLLPAGPPPAQIKATEPPREIDTGQGQSGEEDPLPKATAAKPPARRQIRRRRSGAAAAL